MLLYLLYPMVWSALHIFFRRIEVRGRDQVPRGRPVVLVANHPNVMLDTLVLGLCAPGPPPRFLGKSTLFKNALYAFFLRRLGVIPVARAQDERARLGRNQDMLRLACQTLASGQTLALFPEGLSHPDIQVRALKPGAARIALRVEDETDGRAGVCIVPVGLTYTDPGLFRSQVAVHFGAPVEVRPFLEAYRADRGAGAQALTRVVQERLTGLTWHLEDPALETAVRDLAAIYTDAVADQLPDTAELSSRLRAGQELIRAVEHFDRSDPELVRAFATRLRAHHRKLRRLKLEPYSFSPDAPQPGKGHLLLALLLSPLALYGFLNNALPYFIPRLFVRPYRQTPEMVGTVKLAVGAVAFPLYYLLRALGAWWVWGGLRALLYALTLPLSGLFVLWYNERLLQRWPLWQGLVAPRRRARYLKRLAAERAALLRDLDRLKEHYLAIPQEEKP